ncbi:MAG: hypothetical protein IT454_18990 [Planctomycetes bacterium]|nr:hypothetical protein [Planctomycetota bacterium]
MDRSASFSTAMLALAACQSAPPAAPARAPQMDSNRLAIALKEILRDDVIDHPEDRELKGAPPKADVASTLTLSFTAPPPSERALSADPAWSALQSAVERIAEQARTYEALARRAAEAAESGGEALRLLQDDVRAARDEQQELFTGLLQSGLLSPEEFGEAIVRIGSEDLDPQRVFEQAFRAKVAALESHAAALERNDRIVTVRAVLKPRGGTPQLLQVPDYYEKSDDELADDRRRARTAEFDALALEFAASRKLAAAIEELRAKHGSVMEALRESWVRVCADVRAWSKDLEQRARELRERLEGALAQRPESARELSETERAVWADLTALAADFEALRELLREIEALRDEPSFAALERLARETRELVRRVCEDGEESWSARIARLRANVPRMLEQQLAEPLRASVVALRETLERDLEALRGELREQLPSTSQALEALAGLGAFGRDVDIVDDGVLVPQPIDSLPEARLDLRDNPVGDGDTLRLEVKVWDRATFESQDERRTPLESYSYTSELIRTGWRWSGDVIFTRALDGANDDHFTANAAVSREYHWFSRKRPDTWFNRLDPGIGFHAAQLNMDPDTTTEIGVGLNASLWSGLVRAGIGYDISIDADQEYWYFGFGLIGALERLDELRSSTFGDGD